MRCALMLALPVLLATACATPGARPQPRQRSLMTAEEILAAHASSLYEAIQQLHPEFLRHRGYSSITSTATDIPRVFVDNIEMGDVEFLKQINPNDVAEVRRLSAEEATTRWGTGYVGGAIIVITHAARAREQG